jgi:uncharacterized protein
MRSSRHRCWLLASALVAAAPANAQFSVNGVVMPPGGGAQAAPDQSPRSADPTLDFAYGAYQRGYYATALKEAMKRLNANPKDGPAMTLIAEIYKDGVSVKKDFA